MSLPIVSIIVPVYNAQEYLRACVDSLLGQDFKEIGIILVNDGSTDNSAEICEAYAKEHTGIKVLHQENAGVSAARNAGSRVATAPFICFVDSDDFVSPDLVSSLYNSIASGSFDIACASSIDFFREDGISSRRPDNRSGAVMSGNEIMTEFFRVNSMLLRCWGNLLRKELLDGLAFPEEISFAEDAFFMWEYLKRCKSAVTAPNAFYYHRIRDSSISGSRFEETRLSSLQVMKNIFGEVSRNYRSLYSPALQKYVFTHLELLNSISKSGKVDKNYVKPVVTGLRSLLKEYLIVAKDTIPHRLSAILGAYAFPVYKMLYRLYRAVKRSFRNKRSSGSSLRGSS